MTPNPAVYDPTDVRDQVRFMLAMSKTRGKPGRSKTFVVPGTPKPMPRARATVRWFDVWDLARRFPRQRFGLGVKKGGPAKGHLVHTRPGKHHNDRIDAIRDAWAATYGGPPRVPVFTGPVVVVVIAVWNAPSPVRATRGTAKATYPDVDNVAGKLYLDALRPEDKPKQNRFYPGIIDDDDQAALLFGCTRYAEKDEPTHTLVTITEIADADDARQGELL